MLKIKFENLLVILVLSLIVGYDVIMTSVLNKTLPQLPTILLIGVVLVLSLRFLFIKNFSILFIVSGILLIVTSLCVFLQTGATNFLLYSLLILLLYDVDVDVILKTYVFVAGSIVIGIFLLSLIGLLPNLQFAQVRSSGLVIRNSFGFIYPTDFASHCFYLFIAWGYLLREKYIWLRVAVGVALSAFIIKFCDARLNSLSILIAVIIFLVMYYTKEKKFKVLSHLYILMIIMLYMGLIIYLLTVNIEKNSYILSLIFSLFFGQSTKNIYSVILNVYVNFSEAIPTEFKKLKRKVNSLVDFIMVVLILIILIKSDVSNYIVILLVMFTTGSLIMGLFVANESKKE